MRDHGSFTANSKEMHMRDAHDRHMTTPTLMSRRLFLVAAGAAALAACGSSSNGAGGSTGSTAAPPTSTPDAGPASDGFNPLWIPPVLEGSTFDLTLAPSHAALLDGKDATTIAYNGAPMWGPTLLMKKGDTVTVNVTNGLDEDTTAHWHGVHLPPEMDGGPHQVIAAGDTWSPTWTVKNDAATYWYHPHAHELTWPQLSKGAGGFIIVQDDTEAALALPRTYGVDDIPLVLTSRTFDADSQIIAATIYGDHMLVNGTMNAELSVPAQLVRFRILNAEIERAYTLGFADERSFWVIGTDGGLLNAPVEVTTLIVVPGERYEIAVDLGADAVDSTVMMQSFNGGYGLGYPGGEPNASGAFGSLLNNTTFDVLQLKVMAATADGLKELPASLVSNTMWSAADATNERTLTITEHGPGTPFAFDDPDAAYSMDRIDQTVVLDTVEAWHIQNGQIFGHSFHLHDVQFAIVERSTGPVPDHEKGWKDTFYIQVNEKVTFVAKFDDYASSEHPFMYHCHMANHEDEGLMGQFLVVEA
jgi:blue copper oxidase